jgi:transcriptional regulator with XRE-family HTH domain
VRDLAARAGVHRNTVSRFETDETGGGHAMSTMRLALEKGGVMFLDAEPEKGKGPGVRLRA